jgi:hypothetical protein
MLLPSVPGLVRYGKCWAIVPTGSTGAKRGHCVCGV